MRNVEPSELMSLADYDAQRDTLRRRAIRLRRLRRVEVGAMVSLGFENRETVLYQVHEMLRAERITNAKRVQEELDTYNDLLPRVGGLSATLFIEVPDLTVIRQTLNRMIGVDERVHLRIGDRDVLADSEPGRSTLEKTASVHYVKFALGEDGSAALRRAQVGDVHFSIDHPSYSATAALGPDQLDQLQSDLV